MLKRLLLKWLLLLFSIGSSNDGSFAFLSKQAEGAATAANDTNDNDKDGNADYDKNQLEDTFDDASRLCNSI